MKKLIFGSLCCVLITACSFASYSYNLSIATGYNLIADNLVNDQNGNGNDLNDIMSVSGNSALAGCFLFKFDNPSATWLCSYNYGGTTGWSPNFTLNPGEGAFLANPGSPFSLTFSGAESPTLTPIATPSGLYSAQDYDNTYGFGPSPAYDYVDIIGNASAAPAITTEWLNWVNSKQVYKAHTYNGSAWASGTPQAAVGEAVWVVTSFLPTEPPLYLAGFLTPSGGISGGSPYSLIIVWPSSVSGSPAYLQESTDLVTWTDVYTVGGAYVTSPYTVTVSTGTFLYFRLTATP
jgi:hypothetical protein